MEPERKETNTEGSDCASRGGVQQVYRVANRICHVAYRKSMW